MRIEKERIVPAVIVSFKLQKLMASRVGARQSQRQHGRFAAGVGESHHLCRWNHPPEALGGFNLRRGCRCEVRPCRHRLPNRFHQCWVRMPLDQRSERHHEVDVLIAIRIPNMGALPAFQQHWFG